MMEIKVLTFCVDINVFFSSFFSAFFSFFSSFFIRLLGYGHSVGKFHRSYFVKICFVRNR